METKDHLNNLEKMYEKEINKSKKIVDIEFSSLVSNMERFLVEYKKYNKNHQNLDDLQDILYGEDDEETDE